MLLPTISYSIRQKASISFCWKEFDQFKLIGIFNGFDLRQYVQFGKNVR